jgi:UDP:flavonoid glycosyltransferase YjiC (YdhE family)
VVIGAHPAKFDAEGDTDNIRQVILRYGLEHPVVNDADFIVWSTWGAQAWPTLAIIDPAANVVGGHSGEGVYNLFKPVLDSLVEEFEERIDRRLIAIKLEKEGLLETALSFPGKVLADPDGRRQLPFPAADSGPPALDGRRLAAGPNPLVQTLLLGDDDLMHITIVTLGSRGDVEPYMALGEGLTSAGQVVRLATHDRYESEIRLAGLEFSSIAGDPRQLVEEEAGKRWLESGRNPIRIMRRLLDITGPVFSRLLGDCEAAVAGTDAVLFSVLGFPAYHLAEAVGIPAVGAYLQPMTRTREFPSLFVGAGGPARLNLWSHIATEQITWQPMRREVNRWRRSLGLGRLPISGLHRPVYRSMPVLYGFSPAVVSPPADWPAQVKVTGYWFRNAEDDWLPPENVTRFLSAGPAPVYVGFGSRPEREPEALAELVLSAVRQAGRRAVLLTGWGGLTVADSGNDVLVVDEIPHDWLFPQMSAVVHHGGAGTTGTALQSGVPSVVVPSFADQFFWGERTAGLGVGLTLPRRKVTAKALAGAITSASHPNMRLRASKLGVMLRAENGVERAIAELTSVLGG